MNIISYIAIGILGVIGLALFANSDDNSGTILGALIAVLSILLLIGFVTTRELSDDVKVLQKHIDHDKSRIIKENDEPKELYITVDGEEYHFVFEGCK
jgi:uncharacterized membrane protein